MKVMSMVIAMILAFVASADAQSIVDGHLVDPDGSPLTNTVMVLEGTALFYGGQDVSTKVITDASGHFQLIDLPAGSYSLYVVTLGC